jgi:hypothetical protein
LAFLRRELLLLSLAGLLFAAAPAGADTYTVKAGGGGDFTTVQDCADKAQAGDTCVVYAGTYDETVSPKSDGAPGKPILYTVNPGDCVTVKGFSFGSASYITVGEPNSPRCSKDGFRFSGFEITGGQITWRKMTNVVIQNNYVHHTSGVCMKGPGSNFFFGASTYVYVLNNIFTVCGSLGPGLAGGMQIEGNHWLIDGNTLSHLEDGIYLYGAYMVLRNNTFGPLLASDYTTQHPDGVESTCTHGRDYPLQRMLYENNTTIDWGAANAHGFLLRDTESCGQTSNVIRFSQFINLGSNWIANDGNSTGELIYNNSVQNTQAAAKDKDYSDLVFTHGDIGANVLNNIIANTGRSYSSNYCIFADKTSAPGFVEHHNLCFSSTWGGAWQAPFPGYDYAKSDILNKDPRFVNPSADLHLQPRSPAIGAGGPLTTAVGSGLSSSSLTVANAGFFSDGYGLTGVQADWIRIGPSTTVQIASINYSTNVLTLAGPASWENGAPIYLYKNSEGVVVLNGADPDIGAFPFVSSSGSEAPQPPANLNGLAK